MITRVVAATPFPLWASELEGGRVILSRQSRNQIDLQKRVPSVAMVFATRTPQLRRRNAMKTFLTKFGSVVTGMLCGFDRLFLRGSLRRISFTEGLRSYLFFNRILFKDFAAHSQKTTARMEQASLRHAQQLGREIRYLNSSQHSKEDIAREIAARDRIKSGLICVLRSIDPCMSVHIHHNRDTKKLEVQFRKRKCVHLYHYQIHPIFGFMHARIQTWFPFRVYVCINGREWLARQMDQAGLHYLRRDNTFTWLEDVPQTQALFDQQLHANWPSLLRGLTEALNPIHDDIFAQYSCQYYWSVAESEWASDVMFRSRADLEAIYPRLVRYAVTTFGAVDVLRFMGQPVSVTGKIPHRRRFEVRTSLLERVEGVRLKHWLNGNSVKIYDKGSVLRPECTMREPGDFKVFRTAQGDPEGTKDWRRLRMGLVDLHHRAEVGQAANERYLEALAAVHDTTPLRQLAEPLCRPAPEPAQRRASTAVPPATHDTPGATKAPAIDPATTGSERPAVPSRRVRALNPLADDDATLLAAVSRHEFLINGLRNRELRRVLFGEDTATPGEQRKRSAAVTRKLRLLRAHGLIHKVPRTHRYIVSEHGRKTISALLAARQASTEQLTACAG
jgi:hypothetical protein